MTERRRALPYLLWVPSALLSLTVVQGGRPEVVLKGLWLAGMLWAGPGESRPWHPRHLHLVAVGTLAFGLTAFGLSLTGLEIVGVVPVAFLASVVVVLLATARWEADERNV